MKRSEAEEFLSKLAIESGVIVSSAECDVAEIAQARVDQRFFVDVGGLGYVLRLPLLGARGVNDEQS